MVCRDQRTTQDNWFLPSIMSTGFRLSDRHLHLLGLLTSPEKPTSGQQEVGDFSTCFSFMMEANLCREPRTRGTGF